ncbi:MAG: glucose-fructose oxidoreductase [Verrucomicrobiales bacterium]|nr:glucose-fructose oxidoreductase [Verrucomicrobiales bacterium]
MSERPFGICVVGLGVLSKNAIAPAFANSRHCRLAGIVTSSEEKAKEWQADFGVPVEGVYSFDRYDEMAKNADIDAVFIVLPNAQHAEYSIRAARAGKHVLCEKPLEVSVEKCEQMIAACQEAGRTLATAYRCHCDPHHRELIRLAQTGAFGTLRLVEASFGFHVKNPDASHSKWRRTQQSAGGGALVDVGVYAVQGACYVTGEDPIEVQGTETKMMPEVYGEVDETLCWTMKFPSGVIANCSTSYTCPINRLFVSGDTGWGELSPCYTYFRDNRLRTHEGAVQLEQIDHFASQMDHFAEACRGETELYFPGEMGMRDVKIMTAIYESVRSGRSVKIEY